MGSVGGSPPLYGHLNAGVPFKVKVTLSLLKKELAAKKPIRSHRNVFGGGEGGRRREEETRGGEKPKSTNQSKQRTL